MIYITGDTHGNFHHIACFCDVQGTTPDDILIILGDAGINYYGGKKDKKLKDSLAQLPVTLFCIHGNHERRPACVPGYQTEQWHEGEVYYEPSYPNLLFAKDGEIYNFVGKQCIVIGGAYSVDKFYRLENGWAWWADEQPDEDTRRHVEKQIENNGKTVDVVLSHTCPLKYEPVEVFLSCIDESRVDKSTEDWLDVIEESLTYGIWYCGHFHTEKTIDKMRFMFHSISSLV